MQRLVLIAAFAAVMLVPAAAQVRINEFFTGTPDHVELQNCSAAPVDVSGWTVQTSFATAAGPMTLETAFVIPAATVIPAAGFLILQEFGTAGAPGTLPNSISVGFNYFWVANRSMEVILTDAGGNGIDYVFRDVFGNGPAPNLPAGTNWTGTLGTGTGDDVARNSDIDTDDAADWTDAAIPATTAAENAGQSPGCGTIPPMYETNDAAATIDINGVQGTGFIPAVSTTPTCQGDTFNADSNVPGTLWELVFNLVPLVSGGILTTANGQIVNINAIDPSTGYLNGGTGIALSPFVGPLSLPVNPGIVVSLSAQAVFTDPGNPDGISLSQGLEYIKVANPAPFAGPTADDGTVLIDLAAMGCGPVDFLGTSYDSIGVNANGRVTLGGVDGDFSASVAEAITDIPCIGYWTDFNPAAAGVGPTSITITDTGSVVAVDWVNVEYFGETTAPNTFNVSFDRTNNSASINGLTGIMMNPATGITLSDSIFFGMSPGAGIATDPGSVTFDTVTPQTQTAATDMLYDFADSTAQTAGTPYISGSLAAGTLNSLVFTTNPMGITTATGF